MFGPDGRSTSALGDGGGGGRPRSATARTSRPCSARSCASTRAIRRQAVLDPGGNPFVGRQARGRRSTPTACATPGASRSTAHRRPCDRRRRPEPFEEVDLVRREGRGTAPTSAGRPSRDSRASTTTSTAPDAVPPVLVYSHDHGAARSPAATSCRDPSLPIALRPLPVRRLLRRPAPQLPGRPGRGRRTTGRSGSRSRAELVRRGRRRPHLRDLARGARLPARAADSVRRRVRRGEYLSASLGRRRALLRCARRRRRGRAFPLSARGRARARRRAGNGLRLQRSIGNFERPSTSPTRPAREELLYVVEQGGRSRWSCAAGRAPQHRFSTSATGSRLRGERGLLSIAFDPRYARQPPLLRLLHERRRATSRSTSSAPRRHPAEAGSRRQVIVIPHPDLREPQRRPAPVRSRRATSTSAPATAAAAATRTSNAQNLDVLLGKLLRIDPHAHGAARTVPRAIRSSASPAATRSTRYGLRNPYRFSFDRGRDR